MNIQEKKFIQDFEKNVRNTIQKYKILNKKEKVVAAVSGGKDSTTVLYLLKKLNYNVEAFMIDLHIGKWSDKNLENVRQFCKQHNIKLHILNMRKEFGFGICYIRSSIQSKVRLTNCMICGVIKKWILNKYSRKLKAQKLATGHNLDDEAETILMNFLKGNTDLSLNLGPITGTIKDKKFIPRIKPLYFLKNSEIKKYSQLMNFPIVYESCPCLISSFRKKIRVLINDLEKKDKNVKMKIVKNFLKIQPQLKKSASKVNLSYCKKCGEPSRKEVCKRCELIKIMKN